LGSVLPRRFIPVVAPIFGTLTGGLVYELFIGEPRGLVETWAANNEAEDDQLTLNWRAHVERRRFLFSFIRLDYTNSFIDI
jgi:hypothetical protein